MSTRAQRSAMAPPARRALELRYVGEEPTRGYGLRRRHLESVSDVARHAGPASYRFDRSHAATLVVEDISSSASLLERIQYKKDTIVSVGRERSRPPTSEQSGKGGGLL
jgi:hypothetical protein